MSSKVSTLTVSLRDDVSGKAGQIGRALKAASDQARSMAKAMEGSGASKGFVGNLARLGLTAKDIERVSASLKDYAKASGLAADATKWTKGQAAQMRQWETATIASLRHVQAEQKSLAQGSRDLVAGMGASGRAAAQQMAASRRLIEGMGAPARAVAADQARRHVEAVEKAQARASMQADARKALAGMGGLYVGHKVKEGTHATLHTYREFDKERRFGKAVMGLTDEEQRPLVDQAVHMGATTKYNDVQVLEAQRELAARGLKRDQVMGLMEPAANLGQALDLHLPQAVKQMEGALFGFKKPIGTLEEAMASARQTADLQVKAAKVSGMTPEDLTQAYKYAATPARMSGVSEEMMLAFAGISKKANMGGDESGVAFRALIASTTSPTRKGREALLANGLDFKNYQKNPDSLALEPFIKNIAAQYGVDLNSKDNRGAKKKLAAAFGSKDLIADPAKFTPRIMDILGDELGGDDAKAKKSIAGAANRYRDASMKGIDTNAFIADLMKALPGNLQLANAIFGSKQGSRIATALGDPEVVKHIVDELKNHSEGYAAKISKERMSGYDGATSRFEGAVKNLETAVGRAFDDDGKGGFLTGLADKAARATQALAEMPRSVLAVGAAAAWLTGKVATGAGTLALVGAAFSLKGSAAALTAAAGKLAMGGLPAKTPPIVPGAAAAPGVAAAIAAGSVVAGVAAGGVAASVIAAEAVKNKDFAAPYLDGGILGADPAGYGLGAGIVHADHLAKSQTTPKVLPNAPAQPAPHEFGGLRRVPLPPARPGDIGGAAGPQSVPLPPTRPVEFRVETPGADAAAQKIGEVKAQAEAASGTPVTVPVSAPGADGVIGKLLQIIGLAGQAQSAAAAASSAGAAIGPRASSPSFSDAVTAAP